MFTGIITHIGEVIARDGGRFTVRAAFDSATIAIGASIACDGCCLTVTTVRPEPSGAAFTVDVSNETLSHTTLGAWAIGRRINLERPLKAGDELGGHIVTGHVDEVGEVIGVCPEGDSRRIGIRVGRDLGPAIARKGSIALDGVSLTVNEVRDAGDGTHFSVNIIPHTAQETTLGDIAVGRQLNVEIDVLARYIDRMMAARAQ